MWFSDDAGWRWFTGASIPDAGMTFDGDVSLLEPLLEAASWLKEVVADVFENICAQMHLRR